MSVLSQGIKEFLIPGSDMFLLVGTVIGVGALFGPPMCLKWGRRWLLCLVMLYVTLALPLTSDALFAGLSRRFSRLHSPRDAQGARTIVVLGNGVQVRRAGYLRLDALNLPSAFSALETARVFGLLDDPVILASGGPFPSAHPGTESDVMQAALVELGIPRDRIELERQSRNTREQAWNVAVWLNSRKIDKFVLVTSPEHMRRATALFEKAGLHPTPSVTQLRYGGPGAIVWPTHYALEGSQAAIYEYIAFIYYWMRGWV
jgi:uncharacterized SAM-binding protein YcdF (DUF218 family)